MIDFMGLTGAACITGGVAWIYPPAGLIAGGILLLSGAVIAARRSQPKKDEG